LAKCHLVVSSPSAFALVVTQTDTFNGTLLAAQLLQNFTLSECSLINRKHCIFFPLSPEKLESVTLGFMLSTQRAEGTLTKSIRVDGVVSAFFQNPSPVVFPIQV